MIQKMHAIVCSSHGKSDVLEWKEIDMPKCTSATAILVKVKAAGVNRADILQREGKYNPPKDASPLLGLEVSGIVVDDNKSRIWNIGDKVCGLTDGGGYAEYVWIEGSHCLPIPNGMTYFEAAALPETYFTVWFNVFMQANLNRSGGDNLLIHAGSSGIGVTAIQLGKVFGNKVIATGRSAQQLEKCKNLGADATYLLNDNWALNMVENEDTADVILDILGEDTFENNIKVIRQKGRLVWIAFLTGATVRISVPKIMSKQITLTGSFLRPQPIEVKSEIANQLREQVWPLLNRGIIKPVIERAYPISEVRTAHQSIEQGGVFGKIVLKIDVIKLK